MYGDKGVVFFLESTGSRDWCCSWQFEDAAIESNGHSRKHGGPANIRQKAGETVAELCARANLLARKFNNDPSNWD